jgi:general secretion pathway protein G
MKTQRSNRRRRGQAGVTLIEMLVVVVIIGLFVALVAPNMFRSADKARVTAARSQIEQLMTALGTYKLDTGVFPTTEQGLEALHVKPADATLWSGPYLQKEIPKDPWGTDYSYRFPGEHGDGPDICSLGQDKQAGGEGFAADICSWTNH